MSDIMLHGVLNMPPELWCDSPIDVMQRHSRYVQASQYIDELDAKLTAAREEIAILKSKYADHHSEAERIISEIRTVTEQRDRLAEALLKCREDSVCEQVRMEKCRYTKAADESQANIDRADKALQYLNQPTEL